MVMAQGRYTSCTRMGGLGAYDSGGRVGTWILHIVGGVLFTARGADDIFVFS